MANTPAGFRAALLIGWFALGAAGMAYARVKDIPNWAALPVLAAFLIAYPFYLVPVFPALRSRFPGWKFHAYALACMVLPYLACTLGAVEFQWTSLLRLAALALAMSFWYVVLPRVPAADLAFLALVPLVLLGKYFVPVYVSLYRDWKDLVILGHLALIPLAAMALLEVRRVPDPGYGFIPRWKDWRIGALHFVYFLLIAAPLMLLLQMGHLRELVWWKAAGSFLGLLWVTALSEDFLVQGVLLGWIEEWSGSRAAALAICAVLFGLVHLWFGNAFPNWRMAAVAAVLGWFCGRARLQAGSIRAGMVTHALAATARLFVAG